LKSDAITQCATFHMEHGILMFYVEHENNFSPQK
jgi:hypothetical protein